MKKVEAIIRLEMLDDVKNALEAENIVSMSVSEIRGRGRQKGAKLMWRGDEYVREFVPKTKIELVMRDEDVAKAVKIIRETAHTGNVGDGKIFVLAVEEVIRVRTGETGESAL